MSEIIAVVGQTGTGKSTAVEMLNPKETAIINIVGKPLPFRGWKAKYNSQNRNYFVSVSAKDIVSALIKINDTRPEIKTIVIDDFQYLMSTEFMNRSDEEGWKKFTDIARHAWDVINTGRNLREDLKVFVLSHDEIIMENYTPKRKIKTIGKMLDDKVTLEGLFTIVLFTDISKDQNTNELKYSFITQNDGTTTAKSPKGMFKDFMIPNDLSYVIKCIDEYYMAEVEA